MMKAGSDATPKSTRVAYFSLSVLTGWLVLTMTDKKKCTAAANVADLLQCYCTVCEWVGVHMEYKYNCNRPQNCFWLQIRHEMHFL